ncbi:MAG: molybdopterin-dependent oxidoreductase [Dehalococcoidia bacterium]|nr:molybdopterin-dependent oxidoreductase [Dehalococcoidia bacterium]
MNHWARNSKLRGFIAGSLANAAAGLLSVALGLLLGVPSPPQLIQEMVTSLMPAAIAAGIIGTFQEATRPLILSMIAAGWIGSGGLVGTAASRLHRPTHGMMFPLAMGLALWLSAVMVLLPILSQGFFGVSTPAGAAKHSLLWLLVAASYVILLEAFTTSRLTLPVPVLHDAQVAAADRGRRRLVLRLAMGAAGVAVAASLGRWMWTLASLPSARSGEMTPEVTPTGNFYAVSKNFLDPDVNEAQWNLEIVGLVERPLILSYRELLELPSTEQHLTLMCISNEVGGDLVGTALWKGVRLADLLARADVRPSTTKVVLTGDDDYSDSFPLEKAQEPNTLLAYHMNGAPLSSTHGFPLRALVPNIYGMKNVKWLKRIEAVDYDFKGYWQQRGWSDEAIIQTTSRMDLPHPGEQSQKEASIMGGIAFAGSRGITRVEVSTDYGETWLPAEVKDALSTNTWVLWLRKWEPTPGRHDLLVRAADGNGELQIEERRRTAPGGAAGYDLVPVRIVPHSS